MRYQSIQPNGGFDPRAMKDVKEINEKIEHEQNPEEMLKLLQQRQNRALDMMSLPLFRNYRSYFPW